MNPAFDPDEPAPAGGAPAPDEYEPVPEPLQISEDEWARIRALAARLGVTPSQAIHAAVLGSLDRNTPGAAEIAGRDPAP